MVVINNLTIKIADTIIINDLNCTITPGSITSLIGNSGAGKTTILKALAGLLPITSGTFSVNKQIIKEVSSTERAAICGYVFQQFNLFPHLTALENCIDPLLVHNISYQEAQTIALKNLTELGMANYKNQYSNQLSGGQQQRVAIARALGLNPKVLLLDEPSASLDPENSRLLINILQSLANQGITIILSSQDMHFVKQIGGTIFYLKNGSLIESATNKEEFEKTIFIAKWLS